MQNKDFDLQFDPGQAWEDALQAHRDQTIVECYVTGRNRGGCRVKVFGLPAFLPVSLSDVQYNPAAVGIHQTVMCTIQAIDDATGSIIVSRKHALEKLEQEFYQNYHEGDTIAGVVAGWNDGCAFIKVDALTCLVWKNDICYQHFEDISEVLEEGQNVNMVIKKIKPEKHRVECSIKEALPDPYVSVDIKEGDVLEVSIHLVTTYGAFAELAPGVNGLIYVSELSWDDTIKDANQLVKKGDRLKVKVLSVDLQNKRIALSAKALLPDPFESIADKVHVGDKLPCKVIKVQGLGVSVRILSIPGIIGWIYMKNLSWRRMEGRNTCSVSVDDEFDAIVIGIDHDKRRLQLERTSLMVNPWPLMSIGQKVEAVVESVKEDSLIAVLENGLDAIVRYQDLKFYTGRKEFYNIFQKGDKLEAFVSELNPENRELRIEVVNQTSNTEQS